MNTDAEFLNQLEQLFLKEGFSAITVGELAKRLKCSRRRLYEYSDSKEGLFLLVAERFFDGIRQDGWRRASEKSTASEKIQAYLDAGSAGATRLTDRFQQDIVDIKSGLEVYDRHQRLRVAGLREIIDDGIASGEFSGFHSYLVAEMMLLITARIREPDFQKSSGMTYAEALLELTRIIRHGMTPPISNPTGKCNQLSSSQ